MAGRRKRILVLGGGFAGVRCVRRLEKYFAGNDGVEIVLVSKDNFLLFTPMLPQVASGMIETRHIVMPIRRICRSTVFYEGRIKNIDPYGKVVVLWGTQEKRGVSIEYDFLVIALGSQTNFFGLSDVEKNAYTMKTLNDAVVLRNRVIDMLEQAENETDIILRKSLLTFVIVGAGFAGIETAGELMDLLIDATKYYPSIAREDVRVTVLEASGEMLAGFDRKLAGFAHKKMGERGIEIRFNTAVMGFDGVEVGIREVTKSADPGTDSIRTKTMIWTAGVTPVNTIKRSMFKTTGGKIAVDEFLGVPEFPGVFAVGDCCLAADTGGRKHAPTAQLGEAQAETVAHNLRELMAGRKMRRFEYKPKGQMAIIGKRTGIATILGSSVSGFWAWFLWRNVYLSKIPNLDKRIRVVLDWTIDLFFDRDISRMRHVNRTVGKEYRELDQLDDVW